MPKELNFVDENGNKFEYFYRDHGYIVRVTTPNGFVGQGYTTGQARRAARWYEEEAAKSYVIKPLDEVMAELTVEEQYYWAARSRELECYDS